MLLKVVNFIFTDMLTKNSLVKSEKRHDYKADETEILARGWMAFPQHCSGV